MPPRPGVTMIELVFVLMIIGVMSTIALPRIGAVGRELRIENASRQLASDLARARSEAIRRNETVCLARTGPHSYDVQHLGARTIDQDIVLTASSGDTVCFTSYGSLSSAARSYTLTLGSTSRQLSVSAAGMSNVR